MLIAATTTSITTSAWRVSRLAPWLGFAFVWSLTPSDLQAQVIQICCGGITTQGGQNVVPVALYYAQKNNQEPNWPNIVYTTLYYPPSQGGGVLPGYPQDDPYDPYYIVDEKITSCPLPSTVTVGGTIAITENVSACPSGGTIDIGVSGQNGGNSCPGIVMPQLVCREYCRHGRRYCCCYWVTQPCCQAATASGLVVTLTPQNDARGWDKFAINVTNNMNLDANVNFVYGVFRVPANPVGAPIVPVKYQETGDKLKTFHAVWNADAPSTTSSFLVSHGQTKVCNGLRVHVGDPQIQGTDSVYLDLFLTDTQNNIHSFVLRQKIQ